MAATTDATIPNLNLRQIMASFAYLAYCGQGITTPKPETEILRLINAAMPRIKPIASSTKKPLWSVVWGPAVFTMPGALYQDNMMFVAQNIADPTQFVVAVRGTNFISDLDWLMEDFDVLQMISWPAAANAAISESTSIDLQILLAMKGKSGSTEWSLLDHLNNATKHYPIKVCVTGHSLGGCAAGTLALYLKDNQTKWDVSKKSTVCSITFAAPTAGNAEFATYSDSKFAGQGQFPGWDSTLKTNFDAVHCDQDVAPLAWTTIAVKSPNAGQPYPPLLTIYGSNLDFMNTDLGFGIGPFFYQYLCPALVNIMSPRNYQQVVQGPAGKLNGSFNSALAPTAVTFEAYVSAFIAQAEYQHGSSYPILLGVPELNDPNIIVTRLLLDARQARSH
jgi:Lipase (class 3)